jgi:hypothetical protein
MNIRLFLIMGLLLTSFAFLQAENPGSSSIHLTEGNGIVQAEITVDGYAPDGIKFVWSLNPDPVYPPRAGDRFEYQTLDEIQGFRPGETRKRSIKDP